MLFQALTT